MSEEIPKCPYCNEPLESILEKGISRKFDWTKDGWYKTVLEHSYDFYCIKCNRKNALPEELVLKYLEESDAIMMLGTRLRTYELRYLKDTDVIDRLSRAMVEMVKREKRMKEKLEQLEKYIRAR